MGRAGRYAAALTGLAAGAVTLGVAEGGAVLLARTVEAGGEPSPLLAVGAAFVDLTPAWLKDVAIGLFGTADKGALFVGMALVLAVACAALGEVAARRRTTGLLGFGAVGAIGLLAVLTRHGAVPLDALPTLAGLLAGLLVLARLAAPVDAQARGEQAVRRRDVLRWSGALTVLGVAGVVAARTLGQAGEVVRAARDRLVVPTVPDPVQVPDAAHPGVPGLEPYLTPNDRFYRIDTALAVPQVDPQAWRLRVHGLVEREVEMTFEELLAEPMVEALVTLACVSNPVGGDLAGNAVWTGWPVRELLARAGVRPDADMVLSRSADGWTAGTPLEVLTDERDALLAVGMNGEPLPARHGFPVRLVVPGLYGYVSATKWVTELKVTRFDADEGYWTPRGWSERGPIKTASRIDVPRDGVQLPGGTVVVAGAAWAQTRGITAVQVRVDDGDWHEATLAAEPSVDAWRLWRWEWPAEPGQHRLTVRAADGTGRFQTERLAPPVPDGASGWHTIDVIVGA